MISGVKEIITDEIPLSERSVEIDAITENALLREITKYLKRTLTKHPELKALSAPAIGYQKRIFCMRFDKDDIKTFINPVIGTQSGLDLSRESCSSIPGKEFIRVRTNDIHIIYQRPTGQVETRELMGLAAKVFQHEMDHLDGILLSDVGLELWPEFDTATDEEREEVINEYLSSLDIKLNAVKKEIEEDPELTEIVNASKFIEGVYKGEIQQQ